MGCNVVWRLQRNATNAGSLPPGRHLKTQDCLCGFKNEHLLTEVISHIFCVLSFHFSSLIAAAAWPLVKELPLSEVISACAKRCFLSKPGARTILVSHITWYHCWRHNCRSYSLISLPLVSQKKLDNIKLEIISAHSGDKIEGPARSWFSCRRSSSKMWSKHSKSWSLQQERRELPKGTNYYLETSGMKFMIFTYAQTVHLKTLLC